MAFRHGNLWVNHLVCNDACRKEAVNVLQFEFTFNSCQQALKLIGKRIWRSTSISYDRGQLRQTGLITKYLGWVHRTNLMEHVSIINVWVWSNAKCNIDLLLGAYVVLSRSRRIYNRISSRSRIFRSYDVYLWFCFQYIIAVNKQLKEMA
jgi:hypothetical protein